MDINMIILFIVGLFCGSFFTKVGIRQPQNVSIFTKSKCNSCEHSLSLLDQIPIISFLINKGKCKYCGKSIGLIYPFMELLTGSLFALTYSIFSTYQNSFVQILLAIVFVSSLLIIIITDIKYMLIPNELLIIFASIVVALKIFLGVKNEELVSVMDIGYELLIMFIEAAIMFIIMMVIKRAGKLVFKKDALGGGDVKMMAYVALLLGYKLSIVVIFFGSFIALPVFIYNAYRRSETMLPFGPFLAIASLIIFLTRIDFDTLISYIH